ncbi:MAG: CPBP family intramembrane metalloprotease [Candidatus Hydrogenedentota bacterium]|nr:MAG: CPBP family intramembrane metalloprotease [Candidatus Hydrogenedentota bacterium]
MGKKKNRDTLETEQTSAPGERIQNWLILTAILAVYSLVGGSGKAEGAVRSLPVERIANYGVIVSPILLILSGMLFRLWRRRCSKEKRESPRRATAIGSLRPAGLLEAFGAGIIALGFLRLLPGAHSSTASLGAALGLTALLLQNRAGVSLRILPPEKGETVSDLLAVVLAASILLGALSLGILLMKAAIFEKTALPVFRSVWAPRKLCWEWLLSIVVVPLLEEVVFRAGVLGVLYGAIRPYWGRMASPVAILFSAAVFSFLHFQPEIFWARFLAGIALGALYVFSGRLLAPWLLHSLMNFSITFLPFLLEKGVILTI